MIRNIYINNQEFFSHIDAFFEADFLRDVAAALQQAEFPARTDVYFYINLTHHECVLKPFANDAQNVCIIIDEYYKENPSLFNRFDVVYQAYLTHIQTTSRYYHFPLGTGKNLLPHTQVPLSKRKYNVFFSGNLHLGRKDFYKGLTWLGYLPFFLANRLQNKLNKNFDHLFRDSYIRFTNGFSRGLSAAEYTGMMYNSRIVLCPPGIVNIESFRLYEAVKAGCIVVTTALPEKEIYSDIPVVIIDSWKDVKAVVKELLNDQSRMEALHQQTQVWWERNMTGEAVTKYILSGINTIK